MKKLIFTSLTALAISTAHAGYTLKIPLEGGQGGSLPTGTVQFKAPIQLPHAPGIPAEDWQPTDPEYSVWVDIGAVTSCTNWSPATSTVTVGQSFNQIATDCQQDQERTKQEREIEQVSLEIRNSGTLITENKTIAATSTRTETGTKKIEDCKYNYALIYAANISYFYINGGYTSIYWNGEVLLLGDATLNGNPVNIKGYRYYRGTLVTPNPSYYQVCRTPI